MNEALGQREIAERLAELPYSVEVALDETTDGQPVYIAQVLELAGCIGQGESIGEAELNLHEAKVDYIQSLLEDRLPVPLPRHMATTSSSLSGQTIVLICPESEPNKEKPFPQFRQTMLVQLA